MARNNDHYLNIILIMIIIIVNDHSALSEVISVSRSKLITKLIIKMLLTLKMALLNIIN